jgi:hypothetical protein
MAGELGALRDGLPLSMTFSLANPGAGATGVLLSAQAGVGFTVPAGYVFHAMGLFASSNAALTAGTATFNVTDNTVAVSNGPTALLSSVAGSTLNNVGLQRLGAAPIVAGHVVGVNIVTTAAYLPVTADVDVVLVGTLIAA